jgi:hypothetical protein
MKKQPKIVSFDTGGEKNLDRIYNRFCCFDCRTPDFFVSNLNLLSST